MPADTVTFISIKGIAASPAVGRYFGIGRREPGLALSIGDGKVTAAIHGEAFRLLVKGVPLRLGDCTTEGASLDPKLEV